ncbi:hypothetical protein [Mycobacterium sp. AZCC_0083]|uniref:hypothetical protein n=1 Tax=Mycobacterium sp. AZCC_0083 TaxID=2735882 RepID=UPI00161C3391|nr:hypothetical protein [Mycobacterium sp. AZCC_0083]MBB5160422.1 hypothetical protein [Mycobacterium sp. AZCC_0083]
MSTNEGASFRRTHSEPPVGNQESTSRVVVPFRRRVDDKGVDDGLPRATDGVGEAEEVTTTRRPDPAGGEVLLW